MRKLVIARLIPEMVGAAIRSLRRPVGVHLLGGAREVESTPV